MGSSEDQLKVEQKWGFGMAPIKPQIMLMRTSQVSEVLNFLNEAKANSDSLSESISQVKGLFTRIYKQDQWDWFTVWTQLGRPGTRRAREISDLLYQLRKSTLASELPKADELKTELMNLGLNHYLTRFLNNNEFEIRSDSTGIIYILSTREQRNILKVGYTNRSVEARVKEINSATGVLIPYGVRAMWIIKSAREVEAELHQILAPYRVRQDREFFQMEFSDAFKFITAYVREKREEL